MRFSVTAVASCLFLLFIANSIYKLFDIFKKPTCLKGEECFESFLNNKPRLDLLIFLSDNSKFGNVELLEKVENFDYFQSWEKTINLTLSRTTRNNGSLLIHSFLVPNKQFYSGMTLSEIKNIPNSTYIQGQLTEYAVPSTVTINLLIDGIKKHHEKPVTHLRKKFALVLCCDEARISYSNIPPEVIRHIRINKKRQFLPILVKDIMQMRLGDLTEIYPTTKTSTFTFSYKRISFGKLRFMLQIESTLYQFVALGFTERDLDEIKGVFADTNLYLLTATIFISSIHLLFDLLAFKNDITFWKNQKSTVGLSRRTILWRAFSQSIIFLYLLDAGTSLLVLIPSGIAMLIEFWKVSKMLKTSFSWKQLKFIKDSNLTIEEVETRLYDEECMRYLSYILYPLCVGAAIYSLVYHPYKSWYSWIVNSLANGVYAFGFLFMLPQLFINYKLKSVAALPWRVFTYRAFNTFIDDVFAFIITMPTAHRMACFRDDVVFFIYLYQRWLYPVDKNRVDDLHAPSEEMKPKSE